MQLEQFRWVQSWHLNASDTMFGGFLLSFVDEDTAMLAHLCSTAKDPKFVTHGMEKVNFLRPIFAGERLRFNHRVVHVGNTSMWIYSEVFTDKLAFTSYTSMVAIDLWGQSILIEKYLDDKIKELIPKDEHWQFIETLKKGLVKNE